MRLILEVLRYRVGWFRCLVFVTYVTRKQVKMGVLKRPVVWIRTWYKNDPRKAWLPEWQNWLKNMFEVVTYEDIRRHPGKGGQVQVDGLLMMTSSNENIFRVADLLWGESLHKGQWRGNLMFALIWTNGSANNRNDGHLRRHRAHYDVSVLAAVCIHYSDVIWVSCQIESPVTQLFNIQDSRCWTIYHL